MAQLEHSFWQSIRLSHLKSFDKVHFVSAKYRRTDATDNDSDSSSDRSGVLRESPARFGSKGGRKGTTKSSNTPSADDVKQGQKHSAAKNAAAQPDHAESEQKSSGISKIDCRDHVNEPYSEKKRTARKQKNESDMVEKIPVNQQNQSQQVEESSVTESTLSNSDESSDTNDPEGNGYQRSASPENAANKDDRSSMPNVAESQPAAKGYEVLVDVINTGQVSVTGHKNADNRGAQGSGSTQKQSALTASESGQVKRAKLCPLHKIPKNLCAHSRDDKNYWRRGPCLLPRVQRSGLAQGFTAAAQQSSCEHQASESKPVSVEKNQTARSCPIRSGLSHTCRQLSSLPEASKSSGDHTNTEDSSDELDSSAEKETAKTSKAIGKQQGSSKSIQMAPGGGGPSVNVASRPAAGQSNLVVERASIAPMKSWFGFGIMHSQFLKNIRNHLCLAEPSPLTSLAMPLLREGYDIKCITNGKIADTDFVVIAIERILAAQSLPTTVLDNRVVAPVSLILTMDVERCEEFYTAAKTATRKLDVKARRSHAKCNLGTNVEDMQRGCHLLCVTVTRAGLLHDIGAISFENVRYVLIDDVEKLHEEYNFLDEYVMKRILGAAEFPNVSQRITVLHMRPGAKKAIHDMVKAALNTNHAIIRDKD
ncbi:putative DED1-ATP-dependent RNA helicase [Aphelenchoides avenae]|nr:putative DED1-ATP-dependent RNA helicase [Aphelenchus avenae]